VCLRLSWQNRKGIAGADPTVYIGMFFAYKYGDGPRGRFAGRRKTMASKKKETKQLKKAKALQHTKPLSVVPYKE
jgi:hypothetical protein